MSPSITADTNATPLTKPLFLYIPVSRLVLLSIASFGVYEVYWIYKNWRYIKVRKNLKIMPVWRGIFGIFFVHNLLRRIHGDAEARAVRIPSFSPGALANSWILLTILAAIMSYAPGIAFSILSGLIPSFLCFVPVQRYVNEVSKMRNPEATYYGWSAGHIFCVIFGLLIWWSIFLQALAPAWK